MKFFIMIIALSSIVACSNSRDKSPQNTPDPNNKVQSLGIDCDSDYKSINAESATAIMKDTTDAEVRSVTLMSSSKHGYNNSAYNLFESCFSRKSDSCTTADQMMFNHGGDAKNLSVYGHFILLDADSQAKYDQIDFSKLDELSLKTVDGTAVNKDSIFGNPSIERKMALDESSIYRNYTDGTSFLVLLDDTWSNDEYALFKMKVDEVVPGEKVTLTYQRIAEAPKDDLKNYFCSRKSAVETAKKDSGSVTVFGRSYGGYNSSTFGFEYGVNGFDGHFVKSETVMSFASAHKCRHDQSKMCVQPHVGWVVSYWGGVLESTDSLDEVTRGSWPELQSIDPESASKILEENKTYLISQLNNDTYTFGAIRISEVDPDGRWIKFDWKKVAIEEPFRFAQYTQVPIAANKANGQILLGNKWRDETHFDVTFGQRLDQGGTRTKAAYFDARNNNLSIDNRYFSTHSGIIDVSSDYSSLSAISNSAADRYTNKFQRDVPIVNGHVYLIAYENFWFRSVMAVQVKANEAKKSVRLEYKRIYNGQTIPGKWDK